MKDFIICTGITIFLVWCIVVIKSCLPNMKDAKAEHFAKHLYHFKSAAVRFFIWLDITATIVITTLAVIVIGPFLIIYGAIAKERSNRRWNRQNFKDN